MTCLTMFLTGCGFAVLGCGRLFFGLEGMVTANLSAVRQLDRCTPALEQSEEIYVENMWSREARTVGYDRREGRRRRIQCGRIVLKRGVGQTQ